MDEPVKVCVFVNKEWHTIKVTYYDEVIIDSNEPSLINQKVEDVTIKGYKKHYIK